MKPGKALAACALACAAATMSIPAAAANVNVIVDGQMMTFDQPPVMQAGRVFVPMRAIFERLGATVVYANGEINAQGRGRGVHLVIGSTQANVNGNPLTMDVAPFSVAGRTEVPLRFVAQALGARVRWDESSSTVYINSAGGGGAGEPPVPNNGSFHFLNAVPSMGTTVSTTHPALHGTFSEGVNRDSLRVSVDGRDVTSDVYANPNGFDVTPNFELTPGTHRVRVSGTTASGAPFTTGWSFVTAAGAEANYIRGIGPSAGSRVTGGFTLSGRTLPNSQVHVVAVGSASTLGGLLQVGTGSFQTDTTADGSGNFSVSVGVNAVSGGSLTVVITSTSPGGAAIERRVVYSM